MFEGPTEVEYRVQIHNEGGSLWAEVENLPGCFASGDTMEELWEALSEAIGMYLSTPGSEVEVAIGGKELLTETFDAKVAVTA